ncbi:uncharacterized protein LOC141714877 [Apium graveolens]|uniref:uncharacterized protein LOC141714877 n=1 Tax=Apium graveolens TaxID=4045 RepID=UPI003D7ADE6E
MGLIKLGLLILLKLHSNNAGRYLKTEVFPKGQTVGWVELAPAQPRNQGRKRKTLFSYFSTTNTTHVTTSGVADTVTPTTTATTTHTTTTDPATIVSVAHVASHDLPIATTTTTVNPNAPPTNITSRIDLASLERDPGLHHPIWKYPPNVRDDIRHEYIRLGACQPKLHKDQYPPTKFGNQRRRFQASWFNSWTWLENWKIVNDNERCPFLVHIGKGNPPHKKAVASLDGLTNVTRHIDKVINYQSLEEIKRNRLRMRATIEVVRYLSLQACALRGHDESSTSRNRGNLIEMLKVFGILSVDISSVILENEPKNSMYTSPKVQKDVLHIRASKVRNKICDEVGDSKFCILVDESIDASHKEQMVIMLRFVDVHGIIRERFFNIVNVADITSLTLKKEISDVLTRNNINIHNTRGQGYDGVSNMCGAFNGLQTIFLKNCPYAYYVHCFAHSLQLALVGAAEK